jgi:uncharacterized protein YbbC (DUF1343 family)
VRFGLDVFLADFPAALKGKRLGVLCHAASITGYYEHIVDKLAGRTDCRLAAIFGPQHGLFGQTQDNMIEWEGYSHPTLKIPVYSLYGQHRKPSPQMLEGIDALIVDLQDVGARPYTYIWTVKLCLEACSELGKSVWVLDRPNPIAALEFDGPMLSEKFFSFVGGAHIPLCHRLTMAEMARLLQQTYYPHADLHCVAMDGWWRNSLWDETGLPWVLPSPNMPTLDTAVVYPGMVLLEATNLSEGRGTSRPFEIFGAPFINPAKFIAALDNGGTAGCLFREHGFLPTFNKWHGSYCNGFQIHVTDRRAFRPVAAAAALLSAVLKTSGGEYKFKDPPYEYEAVKMPFDILAGDDQLRGDLLSGRKIADISGEWDEEHRAFQKVLDEIALYPENPQ